MKKKGHIYIGTSGWHYKHWIGTYYPASIKEQKQLGLYTTDFQTVELNNSFYNLPSVKTFKGWAANTPNNFIFSVKASRYITHMKKLNVLKSEIVKFTKRADKLGNKLGPILFQLPPKWKVNIERLELFLSRLPKNQRYALEFRNESWYTSEVCELLRKYNCAFCIYHLAGHQSPIEVTTDFAYIRLHGPGNKYQGSYPDTILRKWAERCREWVNNGIDVYVYFDNDEAGFAAFNALKLKTFLD